MLHDLRAINQQMQIMGPIQRGLPVLTALPRNWPVIAVDIKDCFFSIPLNSRDKAPCMELLEQALGVLIKYLGNGGLFLAPEGIQKGDVVNFLGT